MQIVPFPAYYQSVYTNFDFTSFSLISCIATKPYLRFNQALLAVQVGLFYHPVCKQLKINQL